MFNRGSLNKTHIVILGGGFAGAFAAKHLQRLDSQLTEVELINNTNYFVFQPLLPEVASGTLRAADAVTPLRLMLPNVKVRMADVFKIDFDARRVRVVQGSKRIPRYVDYDHLVLAMGQQANLSFLPGFEDHSFTLKNVADAYSLRNHLIQRLEHADITTNTKLKKRLLTFIIAGAGFSGVETVGEMAEMMDKTLKYYPNISKHEINCILIERGDRILPELTTKLSEYVHKRLSKRGIKIYVNTSITSATARAVYLDNGERILAGTIVTTIGNGPTELVKASSLELKWGKIQTDEFLRVKGFENIWAIGDAALIPIKGLGSLEYVPPTAQFAVREAKCVANNILASMTSNSLQTFFYKPRGLMASIGNHAAVAEIFGFRMSGFFAWLMWRAFYISMLPAFSTKIRVAFGWMVDILARRDMVQIHTTSQQAACRYAHYAKGDVLFRPGQIIDGFYTVVTGKLESRSETPEGEEDFVRILNPGDHWGERTIAGGFKTVSTLTAMEDTKVLILGRETFSKLQQSMPKLSEYFDRIEDQTYPQQLRANEKSANSNKV